jgi:hypothetical protein
MQPNDDKETQASPVEKEICTAVSQHWAASDANDFATEHQIYREDAIPDYPQSGERMMGGLSARLSVGPGEPMAQAEIISRRDGWRGCTREQKEVNFIVSAFLYRAVCFVDGGGERG